MTETVFLFSGQGSHYYRMGLDLYREEPRFRERLERLDRVAGNFLGCSVIDILYHQHHKKSELFTRTLYTHPAIFMVEVALGRTLMDLGIVPDCLIGASLGEFVALALAGILPDDEILERVIASARAFEETCLPGRMIGVIDDPDLYAREAVFYENSTLVSVNSNRHFVVSGLKDPVLGIRDWLETAGRVFQELPISHGFHSPAIDPAKDRCRNAFDMGRATPPGIEVISCLTGKKLESVHDICPWAIAREPVRFMEALETLCRNGNDGFTVIDVGPSGTHAGFARQNRAFGRNSRIRHIMTPFGGEMDNLTKLKQELRPVPTGGKTRSGKAVIFPGQGSQRTGMGSGLFNEYHDLVRRADAILGYSIEAVCLGDPDRDLRLTQYTQPALFVVNALSWLKAMESGQGRPDFLAGHSLGEYNALVAAGVIDFETGLRLVKKRGELMAGATDGAMAAVIGMDPAAIDGVIASGGFTRIQAANINSPDQVVISGDRHEIEAAAPLFEGQGARYILLEVSGAFHSALMADAGRQFARYLDSFQFSAPEIPVMSNVLARPYPQGNIRELLSRQLTHPVKWMESIRYLWGLGVEEFIEIGPGTVLSSLVKSIRKGAKPLHVNETENSVADSTEAGSLPGLTAGSLGCPEYRRDYGLDYACAAGGMAHGIASEALVVRMGRAGMIGYFGAGGLSLDRIEEAIVRIRRDLGPGRAFGMNLLHGSGEEGRVDLFLKHGIANVEAAAYMQMTPALVRYRLSGLSKGPDGSVTAANRIMGKLSRPEVAIGFLSPPPPDMVAHLLAQGLVTREQALLAERIPMADDICVEADSGGHTDMGSLSVLLPAMTALRDETAGRHPYAKKIRIGAAGGIGTPEAAAAAFVLGADFILTGSINQCTVEAGTSSRVKELLQAMNVQDTAYAPAGDMFELGSRVQVLKRGVFFPARANKLYELYRHCGSLDDIDAKTRNQLETRYFKRSFDEVYQECRSFYPEADIFQADRNPKQKMAMVFKWYFGHAIRLALEGEEENRVDFQIYCGPALGAFNQWVRGTDLEPWQNRHVDAIALKLMTDTASLLVQRFDRLMNRQESVEGR